MRFAYFKCKCVIIFVGVKVFGRLWIEIVYVKTSSIIFILCLKASLAALRFMHRASNRKTGAITVGCPIESWGSHCLNPQQFFQFLFQVGSFLCNTCIAHLHPPNRGRNNPGSAEHHGNRRNPPSAARIWRRSCKMMSVLIKHWSVRGVNFGYLSAMVLTQRMQHCDSRSQGTGGKAHTLLRFLSLLDNKPCSIIRIFLKYSNSVAHSVGKCIKKGEELIINWKCILASFSENLYKKQCKKPK